MHERRLFYPFLLILLFAGVSCRISPGQGSDASTPPTPTAAGETSPQVDAGGSLDFVTGLNEYIIEVDETPREFLVYVPPTYDPQSPTPVVFMYHGSNQRGPLMYSNTSWSDHADEHGFIVVYPTSWEYRLLDENGLHEKWNTRSMDQMVVDPAALKDDIRFTRVMVDLVIETFNVDEDRIFASGFSNGGGFVMTRLMVEMRDVFASFTVSGNARWEKPEAALEGILADLYVVLGTRDDKVSEGRGIPLPFPFQADEITANEAFSTMFEATTSILSLADTYTVEEAPLYTTFTFDQSLVGADNVFHFRMVKGMFHVYNNGEKVPQGFDAAELFWNFFMEHPRD